MKTLIDRELLLTPVGMPQWGSREDAFASLSTVAGSEYTTYFGNDRYRVRVFWNWASVSLPRIAGYPVSESKTDPCIWRLYKSLANSPMIGQTWNTDENTTALLHQ